ncbi:Agc/pka protein kinase, partial [Globisporangium splendens]
MGCVNSVARYHIDSDGARKEENGSDSSPRISDNALHLSTPSVACVHEGVMAEMVRYRRPSIRNNEDLDAIRNEEIALMIMLQAMNKNTVTSLPEQECIVSALRENVLFSRMHTEQLFALAKFMFIQVVEPGEHVIKQGEVGDKFYVKVRLLQSLTDEQLDLVSNSVHALQYRAGDVIVRKGEPGSVMYMIQSGTVVCTDIGNGVGVVELSDGDYFGERALLASEPRAATVLAKTDVQVMALDQQTFTSLLGPLQEVLEHNRLWRILESVNVMKNVPDALKKKLFDLAHRVTFEANDIIINEDENGDTFYIIMEGEARVVQRAATSSNDVPFSVEVARVGPRDNFGEMALLKRSPRTAPVIVCTKADCFALERTDFESIFAPVKDELQDLAKQRETFNADKCFSRSVTLTNLERVRIIGVGSYGIVYIAKHAPSGRYVAVKEMWKARLEESPQVHHICSEKLLLEKMDSPFLLKFFTALQDERKVYFVTELLLGGELFRRIVSPSGKPILLSLEDAQFYTACCIKSLEYLHERSIAYRDLKPEGILLDNDGYAKLVDFGFAKKVTGKTYTLCGTSEYLAPEMILSVGHGIAVDSWGLGVLLYEMYMGDSPFASKDDDHLAICRSILQGSVIFPAECDEGWKQTVQALLTRQPERRASMVPGAPNDIRKQPWLQAFNWQALERKTLIAPWKLDLQDEIDGKYFQAVTADDLGEYESWKDVPPASSWEAF